MTWTRLVGDLVQCASQQDDVGSMWIGAESSERQAEPLKWPRPCHRGWQMLACLSKPESELEISYPPATKCAHDFAKAGPCAATGAPSGPLGGMTSPVSRDVGGSVCSGRAVSSRILRGCDAWSKVIEDGAWRGADANRSGRSYEWCETGVESVVVISVSFVALMSCCCGHEVIDCEAPKFGMATISARRPARTTARRNVTDAFSFGSPH
jgi:hypothetical protein